MKTNKHQLTENVKLLQKAVIVDGDKYLILKRSNVAVPRPGKWDLPGGNVEWEESGVDVKNPHKIGLVREIEEETGIEVDPASIRSADNCYAGTYFTAARGESSAVLAIILGWKVVLPAGQRREIKISAEHTEYQWIGLADCDKYDFGCAGEKDGFIRQMVVNALNSDN